MATLVIDRLRDAIGLFCAFLTARVRPSQRALQIARIEREMRAYTGHVLMLSARMSLLETDAELQTKFEEILRSEGESSW